MIKLILLTSFLAITGFINLLNAQAPEYLWAKSAGGSDFDHGRAIAVDGNGNSYVTGIFRSSSITFGSTTLTNAGVGYDDMFIVKYDASGNVVWAKSAGGSSSDGGNGIAVDGSGNTYVTGSFQSPSITFGSTTFTNPNYNSTIFIVKYDPIGNILWAKSPGGNNDAAYGIDVDEIGNCYITGLFNGSITLGSTTINSAGSSDMFIVKYDSNGNVVWAKSSGGSGSDDGRAITVDGNGNSYVTGLFGSTSITFGSTILSGAGLFIVKYDVIGNVVWAKAAGEGFGSSITVDGIGNTYVTGSFYGSSITFGINTLTNAGSYDIFIVKYDASGNVVWAKAAGGIDADFSNGIAGDGNGNSYVTGWFNSSITFGSTTLSGGKLFIVKYDSSGNVVWAKAAGGGTGNSIAVDGSENTYITGNLISSMTFGTTALSNAGVYEDMFIVKLSKSLSLQEHCDFTYSISNMVVNFVRTNPNCTGFLWDFGNGNTSSINPNPVVTYATPGTYSPCFQCNTPVSCLSCITIKVPSNGTGGTTDIEEQQYNSNIIIYPNPSNGNLKISSNIKINSIEIYNILGEKVLNQEFTNEIDLYGSLKGIYFIKFYNETKIYTQKIVVQ